MHVYLIGGHSNSGRMRCFKVGISGDLKRRVQQIQTGNNLDIRLAFAWACSSREEALAQEARILNDCRALRGRGEWFYEHSFMKVLVHMVRQMGVPALSGGRKSTYGVPYSGSDSIDRAAASAAAAPAKKAFARGVCDWTKRRKAKAEIKRKEAALSGPVRIVDPLEYAQATPE